MCEEPIDSTTYGARLMVIRGYWGGNPAKAFRIMDAWLNRASDDPKYKEALENYKTSSKAPRANGRPVYYAGMLVVRAKMEGAKMSGVLHEVMDIHALPHGSSEQELAQASQVASQWLKESQWLCGSGVVLEQQVPEPHLGTLKQKGSKWIFSELTVEEIEE